MARMAKPLKERLLARVRVEHDGCWTWTGSCAGSGYGHLCVDGKWRGTHRISYEVHVGPIPAGLVIDHLCRNTLCCNPYHLEAVTHQENMRRAVRLTKAQRMQIWLDAQ